MSPIPGRLFAGLFALVIISAAVAQQPPPAPAGQQKANTAKPQSGNAGQKSAQAEPAGMPAQKPEDPRFARIKALAGEWVNADDTDPQPKVVANYRVTSAGSAVAETLLPGTPHEMITMYHQDGPDLVMTHYCAAQNQPRMRSKPGGDDKVIKFSFMDGTNMDPAKDGHMHSLTLTFVDQDHLRAEWTYYENGALKNTETFNLVRKKAG